MLAILLQEFEYLMQNETLTVTTSQRKQNITEMHTENQCQKTTEIALNKKEH